MNENGPDYESVFRASWRDRQSAGTRPGELIKNPKWIDAGLVVLTVLLIAGVVALGTITVDNQPLIDVFMPRFW